ncbi:Sterol 3-beta-glucosyltransferase [Lachnellula arida]|uniref:Sterol 3-beta-glucosyltransferase n=1 Tax=Lachnellula arida TaxID=1316785 RepID=A0A8T9BKS7_9HELO|nr:Sterol 3-beta-glucosyltransferase [Lachnellula arida]
MTTEPRNNSDAPGAPVQELDSARPALARGWQTERPQPTTTASWANNFTRRATNTSALNEAIWSQANHDEDDSSSSSSDEDEDEVEQRIQSREGRPGKGSYSRFNVKNDDYSTKGRVSKRDGRLNISVNETSNRGYLTKALGATFLKHLSPDGDILHESEDNKGDDQARKPSVKTLTTSDLPPPKLNIVVMVIGSRGDIQPFLKLGKNLQEYGHRVRIATHPAFRDFVQKDSGLDFFSVGGDPAELMAFMVKNPGMIPTMETFKKGEVGRRRNQMAEMFEGFWRACINATDDEKDVNNVKMMGAKDPFIADAIIANPPCFAHIHCAERLGIPLHLMFTFPYTPTQEFPHPLANIKKTNVDPGYANFISYPLVEMMVWQGLGDLINNFRVKTLGLEPVSTLWAPGQLYRLKVPYTYLWSPGLIPKPKDWGQQIDIAGFVFLDLASSFKPPEELVKFLDAGEPPVYIGFGSIVVDDPDRFTKMIFEAVKKAGVRALVSKGWGGLGDENTPEGIYMLENTPHDWLFPKVKAVVHHGGAGTTAIGLKCGKPTMIVPFFGDQQFWGSMIGKAGAGAEPVPYKSLTADKLADGIKQCLTDKAKEEAEKIAKSIEEEGDGATNAVTSFHRSLVLRGEHSMRCCILEDRVAVWNVKNTNLRLSALAAELLVEKKKLNWKQLRLIRHTEWNDFDGPGEPITGVASAAMGNLTGMAKGIGSVPFKIAKTGRRRTQHEEKKRKKSEEASRKSTDSQSKKTNGKTGDKVVLMNGRANGNAVNGDQINGHANGTGILHNGNRQSTTQMNGHAKGNATQPPISSDPAERDAAEHAPTSKASARGVEKTTSSSELGKKNVNGEPMANNDNAHHHDDDPTDGNESVLSDDPDENMATEMARNVGEGLGGTGEHLARMPMDLSLAIAQGFHNAPRLYGDQTVRRPTRITGFHSGLKAAGQEFVFGIYDGVTGLAIQPYTGARDHGTTGFVKGIGMGLTGFVLKDLAAIIGPFGYTLKGVHKELLKSKQPTHFIRRARIMQGQRDAIELDAKQRKAVLEKVSHGWAVVLQVWDILEEQRTQGLKGRIAHFRMRKSWRVHGAFENVEMAEKALEAWRKGGSLQGLLGEQQEMPRLKA